MTMWILASAMAFSAVEFVRMPLASVRTQTLTVSQPAEQRWQPAVVLLQSSSPLFTVRGAVGPRHVAKKAPPASAAAWLWPSALLAATLVTRVGRKSSFVRSVRASRHRSRNTQPLMAARSIREKIMDATAGVTAQQIAAAAIALAVLIVSPDDALAKGGGSGFS